MKTFKVFYSWQSDLPGNTNRNFLDTCINDAVKNCNSVVDGLEVVADRDTKGITGSPNIAQTIFDKIDECDLFVADVSIINSHLITESDVMDDGALDIDGGTAAGRLNDSKKNVFRYTPNPNVLIELGYAVKCLGWERVICFMNTDYGKPNKLPFDLDHQRVTTYSLLDENAEKSKVKKTLRSIVTDTILELSKTNGPQRKGKSYHVVGTYDTKSRKLDADLVAYDVNARSCIEDYFGERKHLAHKLIEEIKAYKIPMHTKKQCPIIDENDSFEQMNYIQKAFGLDDDMMVEYTIDAFDRDSIREGAAKYLEIDPLDLDEAFFNVGNMRIQSVSPVMPWGSGKQRKEGTDEELEKDRKIQELFCALTEIEELELYLKTFDNVLLFPLAIENNSEEMDTNLEVVVSVEGNCELITPSVDFINPDLREVISEIYQTGFPRDLLYLQDDADIKYEDNEYLYYDPEKPFYGQVLAGFPVVIEDEEYGYAMEHYIATPDANDKYEFHLDSLRAKEKKWIGGMIAVKKFGEQEKPEIKMKYRILSDNTGGNVEGEIVYEGMKR